MKKISVIVPVYNSEKYINRCVDSILQQKNADYEVILIDDGSKDGSLQICKEYEKNDDKVKVYHTSNGGASAARNYGLECATAELITFVDSDDWISPGYLERISQIADEADFLIFGICFYHKNHTIETKPSLSKKVFTTRDFLASGELYTYRSSLTGPVSRVYKKSIIEKNKLQFDVSMNFAEDSMFNIAYLKCCKTVLMDNSMFYCCDKTNENSITHRFIKNQAGCRLKYIEFANSFFSKEMSDYNYSRFVREQLYNMIGSIYYVFSHNTSKQEKKEAILCIAGNMLLNTAKCKKMPVKQKIILWLLRHKLLFTVYLLFMVHTRIRKSI